MILEKIIRMKIKMEVLNMVLNVNENLLKVQAVLYLLSEKPEGYDVTYASMPEIMGMYIYTPCWDNLLVFLSFDNIKWKPGCYVPASK